MGKAAKGTVGQVRKIYITDHAREMIRTRLAEIGCSEFISSTEEDLMNRIDRGILAARREGTVDLYEENVEGRGWQPHESAPLAPEFQDADVHALVRGDRCITVLTGEQVKRSVSAKKWRPLPVNDAKGAHKLVSLIGRVPPTAAPAPDPDPAWDHADSTMLVMVGDDPKIVGSEEEAIKIASDAASRGTPFRVFRQVRVRLHRRVIVEID